MDLDRHCSRCQTRLAADILAGHCPACLLELTQALELDEAVAVVPLSLRRFGDYELLTEIARGGMGVVYRARQVSLNRVVALKMVLGGEFARPENVRRFRQEAEAAARLQHPNIVAIHEIGEEQAQPYFTMDLVEGPNLAQLPREGLPSIQRATIYVRRIAEAVQFAHARGILHRDLKPSNILLDAFDQPRITDFGLARNLDADADLTLTGQALGSPGYVAPEQAAGNRDAVSVASDVYSLGAILYFLLTGRAPFHAETLPGILLQVQQAEPVAPRRLNPSVPRDLETICLKCLEKDPRRRYVSAQELAEELDRFLSGQPIQARPLGPTERAFRWCARKRSLAAALLALGIVLMGGISGIFSQWRRAERLANSERHQRERAEASDRRTRVHLYAADMADASRAVERGDFGLGRRLLEAHRPSGGTEDLRGFEWRYLWQRCQGEYQGELLGHKWIVDCAAFSPDGRCLATGGQDSNVNLWDPRAQTLIGSISAHTGAVWSVNFSPDGQVLATAGSDDKAKLWDWRKKQVLAEFSGAQVVLSQTNALMALVEASPLWWEPAGRVSLWDWRARRPLHELPEPAKSVAFSADGLILAACDKDLQIRLWDTRSGILRMTLKTDRQVWSPSFSPSNRWLAAAGRGGVLVWDLNSVAAPVLLPHMLTVWSAEFAPDGMTLLTAASDRGVRLWDSAGWRLKHVFWGHEDEVWCARFSPGGQSFASGGKDMRVLLWSISPRHQKQALPHTRWGRPLFSPDGTKLVTTIQTGSQPSTLWDVKDLSLLAVMTNGPALGFSSDGQFLLRAAIEKPGVEYWPVSRNVPGKVVELEGCRDLWPLQSVGFSQNGRFGFGIGKGGTAVVFDPGTGQVVGRAQSPEPPIRAAALTSDGGYLAVSTERDSLVYLIEVTSGRGTRLSGHRDFVSGMSFSPDGKLLATGSVDASIRLWNPMTGREVTTLSGHAEETTDVVFSPDGRTLASVAAHESVKLWHVPTGREMVSLPLARAGFHLQFAPDGKRLAVTLAAEQNEAVEFLDGGGQD